jgi:hypothetical protein
MNAPSNPGARDDRNAAGGKLVSRALRVGSAAAILAFGWSVVSGRVYVAAQTRPRTTRPAAEQVPPASPPKTRLRKAVVPFEMLPTNHMLVEARINGKGPYRLIFDLGAPITLLNNRVSEAADVVKPKAPRAFLLGMRGEAAVDKLEVGDLVVTKLPVIVLDHPVLKALSDVTNHEIVGLMGFTFFARYKTTIDYHAHQMTFEPIDYQIRDVIKELPERLMGPKVVQHKVLAPSGMWGLQLAEAAASLDPLGVPIVKVHTGSPADRAGLKARDALITVDGRWTTSILDVFHAAAAVLPGREVNVVIRRDGKEMTLTVVPASGA